MTKIKFCGITNAADAAKAVSLGVDAIGFNFYEKSSRFIPAEAAQVISRLLPPHIWRVGVFVNADASYVEKVARTAALTTLQFHGDEPPAFFAQWKSWQVIKAIRPKSNSLGAEIAAFSGAADYLLFDQYDPKEFGGTGKLIGESALSELESLNVLSKAFLAGGLKPGNVGDVVRRFNPLFVDVASGIESAPGEKDHMLMTAFVTAVRSSS